MLVHDARDSREGGRFAEMGSAELLQLVAVEGFQRGAQEDRETDQEGKLVLAEHWGRASSLLMLLLNFLGKVRLQPRVDLSLRAASSCDLGKLDWRQRFDAMLILEPFRVSEDSHSCSLSIQRKV